MKALIELSLKSIIFSKLQNDSYVMTLEEVNGEHQIPIVIGGVEAQSIIIAVENRKSARPLTHDLFCSLAEQMKIYLQYIVIYKFKDGIFYSILVFKKTGEDETFSLDARTSDAVALAIRCSCPMYTYEEILQQTGITLSDIQEEIVNPEKVEENTLENLQELMDKAIKDEDYEKAVVIRDEIKKRKTSIQ